LFKVYYICLNKIDKVRNEIYKQQFKSGTMKTTVKHLAAGTFLTMLLTLGTLNAKGTELRASGAEAIETSIQLENWMTDERIWKTNPYLSIEVAIEAETEGEAEIETWMTSADAWELNNQLSTVTEIDMELESWMTSEDMWNLNETAIEEELTLENWMIDVEVWE